MALKFFWNGIKGSDGKLQLCSYSSCLDPDGEISIYGKRYRDFSPEIREFFQVQNNTEIQSDYFENDCIRVKPSHPFYSQVFAAWKKQCQRRDAKHERYMAKLHR